MMCWAVRFSGARLRLPDEPWSPVKDSHEVSEGPFERKEKIKKLSLKPTDEAPRS